MASGWGFTTKAIHGGKMADAHKSVAPPLYQTATFYYDTADEGARLGQEIPPGYVYTRWANPTTRAFEEKAALLEGAEDALATASGMAAVSTAVLTALRRGEHAVAPSAIYQATYQLFADILPSYGIETTVIPDGEVASYERALRPTTKLLYIETPNNPLLGITDIAGVVGLARGRGALTIADNTFATPYNQNPIALGVDVVVHSATKYLGGHHDLTAGVLAGGAAFIKRSKRILRIFGATIDPFGAWLAMRGVI
ncbi:MAG TPA: aminotransferase class I/II-fold pyridoxal phosphate-dependent enzyme, partial [Gemmatimonadaceae bacterium]